ncbi:hypothetical protein [Telluria aromaticivorans]|uniref:DUF2306 domain-containing protein n=1 Tax=Telluria aromaticivorans TaxID=2725995 RepID=A0A7Y2NYZ9_9BURK|nr:hypothetical protein [Telluria aromaticivorans]NNG22001.1 hypothetical protein [Telluria aromaticivorans]
MAVLTTIGIAHTAISLVALGAGIRAFIRYKEISPTTRAGTLYIVATVLTCLTSFFIFNHGGVNEAHALGVLTLLVLAGAAIASRKRWFGRYNHRAVALAYSLTFFFHMIPGFTETGTRFPTGNPLYSSREDPALVMTIGVVFAIFVIGAILQLRHLRAAEGVLPRVRPRMPAV